MLDIHNDNIIGLKERFIFTSNAILMEFGKNQNLQVMHANAITNTILAMYSAGYKHYHTYAHIMDIFDRADRFKINLNIIEKMAILFHDVVYVPGYFYNEEASIRFMGVLLLSHQLDPDALVSVSEIIRHTALFMETVDDEKSFKVLDLDLSTLAAEPEEFAKNNLLLEREYSKATPQQRAEFLMKFEQKPKIYYNLTELEPIARANIAGEIKRLLRK